MDPLTHTLVGVGMAHAFFRRSVGRGAVPILMLASNLPDVDALAHLSGDPAAVLMRRTFGHSLLLIPFWSLGLALVLRRFYPEKDFRTVLPPVLLGAYVHVFFDLINSFGVVPLWPFSDWRPELAMVFIIDPWLTGILALPLLPAVFKALRGRLVLFSRISLACLALYLVFCSVNRTRAAQALRAQVLSQQSAAEFTYVFPEPLGPHRWRGVVRRDDRYDVYLIHSLSGRVEAVETTKTQLEDGRVQRARQTDLARRLEWFFKAPVWQVKEGSAEVSVFDLRFKPLVIRRGVPFVYRFQVLPGGGVRPVE